MKIAITVIYVLLIGLFFLNIIVNPDYGFVFYLCSNLVIFSFFTVFNFMELKIVKANFTRNDLKMIKYFNLTSFLIILASLLLYFVGEPTHGKIIISFYLYSLNLLLFGYSGYKQFKAV